MSDDLITWLRDIYDERERTAREGIPFGAGHWQAEDSGLIRDSEGGCVVHDDGEQDRATAEHIADNDPAYVLADLDAKRRILDGHPFEQGIVGGVCGTCHGAGRLEVHWDGEEENLEHVDTEMVWPCPTVRLLASVHADRPGYRDEWRPSA